MSTNVYLNNKVRDLPGFKSVPDKGGSGDNMTFNDINVFGGKGLLHLIWNLDNDIPEELKDLVEKVSCYEAIPRMSHRESGIYQHKSAECELTPDDYGNAKRDKPMYALKITAKNLEDIRELLRLIKTGPIQPEESYEGPQGGKSRRQLEDELAQIQRRLDLESATVTVLLAEATIAKRSFVDLERQFNECNRHYARLRTSLARVFEKGFLPLLTSRSRLVRWVETLLDNTK